MIHSIFNNETQSEIQIDETDTNDTLITIIGVKNTSEHYLSKKDLSDFIGALLHVQSKKNRKR